MSSAATPVEIVPGHRESHSGVGRKLFAFPPESVFVFSPESCSPSPRNRFRVHPGIPFALPRNPHLRPQQKQRVHVSGQLTRSRQGFGVCGPILVAALVLLATLPATRCGYIELDDQLYLHDHPPAQGLSIETVVFALTSTGEVYWHPLTWLSHALDVELFGPAPAGHHFTSILLHALTAALLCLVLIGLGAPAWTAAAGALLWALHPLRVESFAWLAERKDVICAAFFLAAILAYLHYLDRRTLRRYAAWLCLGLLALMSKPTAVSLPVILLLLDFWPHRRQAPVLRLVLEKSPLAAGAAAVVYLTVIGQRRAGATTLLQGVAFPVRLANAAVSCSRYLGKMFWPANLNPFYPYHPNLPVALVIASAALFVALTALASRQRKRRPWLLFGWLWFLITLLPSSGLVQAGWQSMADRFTHLPMVGIVIAVAWTVSDWAGAQPPRQKAAAWIGGVALVALAALTIRQIGYWHDTETLFLRSIALEDSAFMRDNLASTLMRTGRDHEAELHLVAGVRLAPQQYTLHNELANIYRHTGRLDQALAESNLALALAPDQRPVVETAGMVHLRRGDYEAALGYFDQALRRGTPPPTIAAAVNDVGAWLASQGRTGEAEPLIRKAVELNPLLVQARRNLVLVLQDRHRPEEARHALEQAIQATGPRSEYRDLLPPRPAPLPTTAISSSAATP
jgi:tetratricopeptide (TPR) repeat protein